MLHHSATFTPASAWPPSSPSHPHAALDPAWKMAIDELHALERALLQHQKSPESEDADGPMMF